MIKKDFIKSLNEVDYLKRQFDDSWLYQFDFGCVNVSDKKYVYITTNKCTFSILYEDIRSVGKDGQQLVIKYKDLNRHHTFIWMTH